MPQKTLVIDDAVPFAQALFQHLGEVILMPGRDIQPQHLTHADALIVRSRTQVNANLLKNSKVEFVGSTVVGLDHIDQAWLAQKAIRFYSAQGCNANSVAEYVISSLFEIADRKNINLFEQTLGIIGVGHVGKWVEKKARTLGLKVLLNDPPRARTEQNSQFMTLNALLEQADILTFHTPLTFEGKDKTHHLLNANNFGLIKPNAIIVNAARGGIIDEQAWCKHNTLANIIDCWENEPFINPELYHKADIATAHLAGHSLEAKVAGGEMVYHALCQHWNIAPQTNWQALLPSKPQALTTPDLNQTWQSALHQLLKQAYDPVQDDLAIRSEQIEQVYEQFEIYRRNYPIRREWHQHSLPKTQNSDWDECLQSLGFMLY